MNTEEAINLAGSPAMLARILGVTNAAVSQFRKSGSLPDIRALQLYTLRPEWFRGRQAPVVRPKVGKKRKAQTESA